MAPLNPGENLVQQLLNQKPAQFQLFRFVSCRFFSYDIVSLVPRFTSSDGLGIQYTSSIRTRQQWAPGVRKRLVARLQALDPHLQEPAHLRNLRHHVWRF